MSVQQHFLNISGTPPSFLTRTETTLNGLTDPELGQIGQRLIAEINAAECILRPPTNEENQQAQQFAPSALYKPFTYDDELERTTGDLVPFINAIEVADTNEYASSTISISHEGIHGIAWNKAPVLHASPYNGERDDIPTIVLCPEDWATMVLRTEADAFAKQALISSNAKNLDREFYEASALNPVSAGGFETIRGRAPDVRSALKQAAIAAMKNMHHLDGEREAPFGEHYVGNAIETYETALRLNNPNGVIFVRMDNDDMIAAGETLGINLFEDTEFTGNIQTESFMTPALRTRMDALNERLGTSNYTQLPTFREALAQYGLTPDTFLEQSKNYRTDARTLIAAQETLKLETLA